MTEIIEHKCPCCGAALKFDVGTQQVRCEFCSSSYDPGDLVDDGMFVEMVPDDIALADNGGEPDSSSYNQYVCDSCGGEIYTEPTTSATQCPFCGNPVMLKGRLSGILMPDLIIPFKKDKESALRSLEEHCNKKRFVPKGFRDDRKLEEVKGLYVPYWVYDAEVHADLEYLGVKENLLVPGKQKDVVERKYYRVKREGRMAFDHIPADASSKMPDDLMESIEPFDHSDAVGFNTSYLSGFVADRYDVEQEEAAKRVRHRISEEIEDRFKETVQGFDEVRLKKSDIETVSSNVDYILYPVWMFHLSWAGRGYTFAMNGQTGKTVGNLPVDSMKLGALATIIFIIMTICAFYAYGPYPFDEDFMSYMVTAMIINGAVASFVHFYFKTDLESVESKHGSGEYYREGSMEMEESDEEFLYRKIEMAG